MVRSSEQENSRLIDRLYRFIDHLYRHLTQQRIQSSGTSATPAPSQHLNRDIHVGLIKALKVAITTERPPQRPPQKLLQRG